MGKNTKNIAIGYADICDKPADCRPGLRSSAVRSGNNSNRDDRELQISAIIALIVLLAANTGFAADTTCTHAATQADLNLCTHVAASAEQKKLDSLLAELKQSLSPANWNILERSQALWEKSRKLDCRIEGSFFDGGSIEPTIVNGCYDQHTSDRIHRLRYYLCPDYAMTGDCEAAAKYK